MVTLSFIINFLGAILLTIGSSLQTGVITQIIDIAADKYGTWGMNKIPNDLLSSFRKYKNLAFWVNIAGYIFLITGFGLQLFRQISNE